MASGSSDSIGHGTLTISVDTTLRVSHEYKGDPRMAVPMIGAIEVAKLWMLGRLKTTTTAIETSEGIAPRTNDGYISERRATKPEALAAYRYALSAMTLRIKNIEDAPDGTDFVIDPDLLAKL